MPMEAVESGARARVPWGAVAVIALCLFGALYGVLSDAAEVGRRDFRDRPMLTSLFLLMLVGLVARSLPRPWRLLALVVGEIAAVATLVLARYYLARGAVSEPVGAGATVLGPGRGRARCGNPRAPASPGGKR